MREVKNLFDENSRVCFIGDSITANSMFTGYIFDYYKKIFQGRGVKIFNCGVSGDTAFSAFRRLETDVDKFSPTEVVIMFGLNDVGRHLYGIENPSDDILFQRSVLDNRHIDMVERIVRYYYKKGVKVTLCSPTPYDEFSDLPEENKYGICDKFNYYFKQIQRRCEDIEFKNVIDFLFPMLKIHRELIDVNFPSFISEDRVHLTELGFMISSRIFLASQGCNIESPSVETILNGRIKLPDFSPGNATRAHIERCLRMLWFVDHIMRFGQEEMNDFERVEYIEKHSSDIAKQSPFMSGVVTNYIKYKLKQNILTEQLIELT